MKQSHPYSRKAAGKKVGGGRPAYQGPNMQEIYEAELEIQAKLAKERAANYKNAWDAEKLINNAQKAEIEGLRQQLMKARAVTFLRGVAVGGFLVATLGWTGFQVFMR